MTKLKLQITGMTCASCSARVERAVAAVDGVTAVSVNLVSGIAVISYSPPASSDQIRRSVLDCGYGIAEEPDRLDGSDPLDRERKTLRIRLISSLILLIPLLYLTMGAHLFKLPLPSVLFSQNAGGILQAFLSLAILILNRMFFLRGIRALRHGSPSMDTLVSLGSAVSYLYSLAVLIFDLRLHIADLGASLYFDSSSVILTLVSVGKLLEAGAKIRSNSAVRSLRNLTPVIAHRIDGDSESDIPAEDLQVGNIFRVRPGECFPADGIVLRGSSAVNESMLTGESLPAEKSEHDPVSAATINGNGTLVCQVTQAGSDTLLQQIIRTVEESSSTKAPIARIADQIAGVFVPVVLALSLLTFLIWLIAGRGVPFSLVRAVSVLVISCPCSLGLATPIAIVVGNGIGARHGILYKSAESLEICGSVEYAVFDKTGTVTSGHLKVTDCCAVSGTSEAELRSVAYSLEQGSEHPIARALVDFCKTDVPSCTVLTKQRALPGYGLEAVVRPSDERILSGNRKLLERSGVRIPSDISLLADNLSADGKTTVFFGKDNSLLGLFALEDSVREESRQVFDAMHELGVSTAILSGDNTLAVRTAAKKVGADACYAELLPADKASAVTKFRELGRTIMVGDGINDAPSLTSADIGVAIAGHTDIASEAADIVLLREDLLCIPAMIRLSRQVRRNIKENLFWAFFYNCIGIPIAAGVLEPFFGITLTPVIAAAAMSVSSLCVVCNALRLNFFDPFQPGRKISAMRKEFPPFVPAPAQDMTSQSIVDILSPAHTDDDLKGVFLMKKSIHIEGMMCMHCSARVKQVLSALEGVENVEVSLDDKCAVITYAGDLPDDLLIKTVTDAGYEAGECRILTD